MQAAVQAAVSATPAGRSTFSLLPFDDTRSPFNGVRRQIDVNNNSVRNEGGPTVWFTDAFGRNARPAPFPGSIRQRLSSSNNDYGVGVNGPTVGGNRDYGGRQSGLRWSGGAGAELKRQTSTPCLVRQP